MQNYIDRIAEQLNLIRHLSSRQLFLVREAEAGQPLNQEFIILQDERERAGENLGRLVRETKLDQDSLNVFKTILQSIETNDGITCSIMERLMGSIKAQVQSNRSKHKALAAYSPPSLDIPWFFDKKK